MAITNKVLNARFGGSFFQLDLAEKFANSTLHELQLAGKHFERILESYTDLVTNGSKLKAVNQHLADGMREAALEAYKQNVLQERVAPSYRENDPDRFAGGKLLRALADPSMATGTAYGIGFINTALLDRAAAQWYRLNFGAAPGQGFSGVTHSPPAARIRFGSNQGISLALTGGMGSGFRVPRGTFFQGAFFLGRRGGAGSDVRRVKSQQASGIKPRRFLDQGLVSLAENFGPAYKNHFQDSVREAVSRSHRT